MTHSSTPFFPVAGPLRSRSAQPSGKQFPAAGPAAAIAALPHPAVADGDARPTTETDGPR